MQSNMDSKNTKQDCWHDITTEFRDSVVKLHLGELIKPDSFTLLEAMSAIELMDPKMDSGAILKKVNREILSFEQSIKANKVKINGLELHELIGIIDDTYATITTWLDGNPLAMTVMTNLYLHDTDKIEDRSLKVFCQAILKLVEIIDRMIGVTFCIEEEDFMLNNGKFNLADNLNDQKVLNALDDLCRHYEKIYGEFNKNDTSNNQNKKTKHGKSTKRDTETTDDTKIEEEFPMHFDKSKKPQLGALITRLRFTHNIYACFLNISKNLLKDHTVVGVNNPLAQAQKTIKLVQSTANNCDQYLEICIQKLDKWEETIDMGLKPLVTDNNSQLVDCDYPTIMGFDPLLNHKSLPACFPRFLSMMSRPDSLSYLKNILIKLRKCIAISSHFHQSKSFIKPLEEIEKFSKYFEPKSCVISRSFLQTLYLSNRIVPLLKEEILQSMTEYCEPVVHNIKRDGAEFLPLNDFLEESAKLFSQIIMIYGHNPARQYEKLSDIIVSFRNLQYSAYLISDVHKNMMVYSWTTYYFMRFCIKYLLSGLELELFSPHEYPYVFWYIYEVLLRNEREQLDAAKKLVVTTVQQTMNNDILNGNVKNLTKLTKTKVKKRLSKLDNMMEVFHDKNLRLNEAMGNLIHGLYLLTFGLKMQGIIKSPPDEFTNTRICFERRFNMITGGSSVYFSYAQSTAIRICDLRQNYHEASARFRRAIMLFERCEDQAECLAVSKANNVVASILLTNPDTFVDRQVEFCFDKHPSLPIVKI